MAPQIQSPFRPRPQVATRRRAMNWMAKWAGAFPPFVREAQGAHFVDVDGNRYVDLCLGDTGAMTGHSRSPQ